MRLQWLAVLVLTAVLGCGGADDSDKKNDKTGSGDKKSADADKKGPDTETSTDESGTGANESESTATGDRGTRDTDSGAAVDTGAGNVADPDTSQPPEVTAQTLLERAQTRASLGDGVGALQLAEQALDKEPQNPLALAIVAQLAQMRGIELATQDRMSGNAMLFKSADAFRRLAELGPMPPEMAQLHQTAVYNEACTLAITGQPDKAIEQLKLAIELGFADFDLVSTDADFESIREDERYKAILESMRPATDDGDTGSTDDGSDDGGSDDGGSDDGGSDDGGSGAGGSGAGDSSGGGDTGGDSGGDDSGSQDAGDNA